MIAVYDVTTCQMPQKPLESSAAAAQRQRSGSAAAAAAAAGVKHTLDDVRARVEAGAQAASDSQLFSITTQIRFGKIRFSEPEPDSRQTQAQTQSRQTRQSRHSAESALGRDVF